MQTKPTVDMQIAQALYERSATCERGVLAVSVRARAGVAKIAPNLLVWSWIPLEDPRSQIFDLHLN